MFFMCWGDAESSFHVGELANARGEAPRQVSTARLSWLRCERVQSWQVRSVPAALLGGTHCKLFPEAFLPIV